MSRLFKKSVIVLVICLIDQARILAGPTLSDANLFSALNLNYPGLERVKTNVAAANYTAAKTNLANYLRSRTNVVWYWNPHQITNTITYDKTTADNAVTGRVSVVNISYTFSNSNIDWLFNVTTNPANGYAPNNEWQWQLNRMNMWPALGDTYWGTSNENYVRAWTNEIENWFNECLVPTSKNNNAGSPWRTIEAGIRMGSNWPNTYFRCLTSPSLNSDVLVDYLKSCIEHGRYLRSYPTASGNWVTIEQSGLYTDGVLFPELIESADWRSVASQTLYVQQTNLFYPDGAEMELTPSYDNGALGNILNLYTVAAMEGRSGELPANYTANMETAYAYFMWMLAPDGTLPQFNDSIYALNGVADLQTGYSIFTNRTDFLYASTHGTAGTPPAQTSYSFPYAGYNIMRSGWGSNDNYFCLCAGPLGLFHQHQDGLNVVLWAYGRELLFDSGGGNYATSLWRSYGISSPSHNTMMVDNQEQIGGDGNANYTDPDYVSQAPLSLRWESTATHDFAAGVFNRGYGNYTNRPATHNRRVLFIKPDVYLIADTLIPTNNTISHTYEARWHLLPTTTIYNSTTKAVSTADSGKPNLAIVPCLQSNLTVATVVGQSNGPSVTQMAGWNIIGSGTLGYTTCTTVKHTLSAAGTNQLLTLLLPLAAGATSPVSQVLATGANSARVDLTDGRKFYVAADPNPVGNLQFTEVLASGVTNRNISSGLGLPSISDFPDQLIARNTTLGPVTFTVGVSTGSASNLLLNAHSTNQVLVPDSSMVFGGTGITRTLKVTPAANIVGTTGINVSVTTPGGGTITNTFQLTVIVPPSVTVTNLSIRGGNLTLFWPTNYLGWSLQVQTNAMNVGLSTNWVTVRNSASTNRMVIPFNSATVSVFYRLANP